MAPAKSIKAKLIVPYQTRSGVLYNLGQSTGLRLQEAYTRGSCNDDFEHIDYRFFSASNRFFSSENSSRGSSAGGGGPTGSLVTAFSLFVLGALP
jgi:hypothetical protein